MRRSARYSSDLAPLPFRRFRRDIAIASTRSGTRPGRVPLVFPSLRPDERAYLQHWTRAADKLGIDAVADLRQRAWPGEVGETIIGIFRQGGDTASWLIVGDGGRWAVARCDDGHISTALDSLAEALSVIGVVEVDMPPVA